jgi:hypothetical protein
MPKYFCEYCEKRIQDTRKLHCRSEGHRKNKEAYYAKFGAEGSSGIGQWMSVESEEEKQYFSYLNKKFARKIYSRFIKRSDKPF